MSLMLAQGAGHACLCSLLGVMERLEGVSPAHFSFRASRSVRTQGMARLFEKASDSQTDVLAMSCIFSVSPGILCLWT